MVAPNISGYAPVHQWRKSNSISAAVAGADFPQTVSPFEENDVTGGFGAPYSQGNDDGSTVAGVYSYYTILSTPQSISNPGEALVFHGRVRNSSEMGSIRFALFSGGDVTEYRLYDGFPTGNSWIIETWYPCVLGDRFSSQTAGFNPANITGLGVLIECISPTPFAAQGWQFQFSYGDIFKLNNNGITVTSGDAQNPASLDVIRVLVEGLYNTNGRAIQYPITVVGSLAFASDLSLDIQAFWNDSGVSLLMAGERSANSYQLNIASAVGSEVSGLTILGSADIAVSSDVNTIAIYGEDTASGEDYLLSDGTITDITVLKKTPRIAGGRAENVVFSNCNPLVLEQISSNSSLAIRDAVAELIVISLPSGNYSELIVELESGMIQLSGGGGNYDFSGFISTGTIEFDPIDGGDYSISVGSEITAIPATQITNGSVTITAPQVVLQMVGIPDVPNALVYVKNLSTDEVTFPTVSAGEASIPINASTQYQIRADAPGYLPSPLFTVPSTVTRFEFNLEDQRLLYDTGTNRSTQIEFDYTTYEITVTDTADISFADFFRTLEDYFSTPEGIVFLGHARPVTVSLGNGVRNYLFFPPEGEQVNPVKIRPNPLNTTDPTFTDFVIILEETTAPLFDIFDFSLAGGRVIRFQTDSVVANVSVSGGSGSGGGATAAEIYSYFTAGARPEPFKATGFSTHSAVDVWAVTSRTLTAIDKTGYSLSTAERATLAVEIEAALLNEGDGQALIDAIVTLINTNLDLPLLELAAIANQVRLELTPELTHIQSIPLNPVLDTDYTPPLSTVETQAAVSNALTVYDPPTRGELTADKTEILTTITPANIYTHFVTNGLSTHSAADVWAVPIRTLTTIDKTGYSLSPSERSTLTTQIEAALLNDGDGQALIDAIVTLINTNLDLPLLELAAIANQVRLELAPELSRIDTPISSRLAAADYTAPLNSAAIQSALISYGAATSTDVNNVIAHGNVNWSTATGFSTHGPTDIWSQTNRTLTDKSGFELSAAERSTLVTQTEAALLNDGDGQALIDAILQVINSNLDLPALELAAIASQVRTELTPELSFIDVAISSRLAADDYTVPLNSASIQSALTSYGAATSTDVNNVIAHGNVNWSTATGFSTHGPTDIWTQSTRSLTDKSGFELSADLNKSITQISIDTAAVARGRFKINIDGTGTQYSFDGNPLQAFNFLNSEGNLANPLEDQILERIPT